MRISSRSVKPGREPPLSPSPKLYIRFAQGGGEFFNLFFEFGLSLRSVFAGIFPTVKTLSARLDELL